MSITAKRCCLDNGEGGAAQKRTERAKGENDLGKTNNVSFLRLCILPHEVHMFSHLLQPCRLDLAPILECSAMEEYLGLSMSDHCAVFPVRTNTWLAAVV